MTLLQLVQSKSPREHGTMVELIEAINTVERVIGETVHVYIQSATTNRISADISSMYSTGNIDIPEHTCEGSTLRVSGNMDLYSIATDIEIN